MTLLSKIDSNITGLSIAREASIGVLPGSPVWFAYQPNDYGPLGGELTQTARSPISQLRQERKGVITDLDASASFPQDLTMYTFSELWPGVFQAEKTKRPQIGGRGQATAVAAVSGTAFDLGTDAAAAGFVVGMLVHSEGFGVAANNTVADVRQISAVAGNEISVPGLSVEASPPQDAIVRVVGFEFASADVDVVRPGGDYPRLVATVADFTDFGLSAGEFIFVGGTAAADRFSTDGNNGLARVHATPTATTLIYDLSQGGSTGAIEPVAETGTGKTIQIFFADVIRNVPEDSALAVQATYTIERSLGQKDDAVNETQGEAVTGALANNTSIAIPTAEKIEVEIEFLATNSTNFSGAVGFELPTDGATIELLPESDAFNTTDNVPDIRLFTRSADPAAVVPGPFFSFVSEATLNVSNNATALKAVGTLGAFAVSAGNFTVSTDLTGYFQDVAALDAVRNNSDVGFYSFKNLTLGGRTAGILIDLPFGSVSTRGLNVSSNTAITAPLTLASAVDPDFNHTMILHEFWFLPA